ncbi:ABC transporter permease [Hoyosella sp. YIM 151337]|uniref:ABC transporter permease n=1 Tax=Hoyosella sp. YIM 151337 TaxID=2992742 RepID=UPI002235867C|nr:ABC transporter permease [Hoyosella sp. YIM 151337]MCW4354152.1 ABC transporter permease [Hoyosella sp. YIM 151337]
MSTVALARQRDTAGGAFTGTGQLIRFMLRRDRIRLPVWIASLTAFVVGFAATLPGVYASFEEQQLRAALIGNPGTRAMTGPGYGLDHYTFGAMIGLEFLSWTAVFLAIMSILMVVRHTRAEEESGTAELLRSTVVGRHAVLSAAVLVTVGANLAIGLVIGAGLGALGIESVTWAGSLLFGLALASIGIVFAAVAAVTSQIAESARAASGLAGAVFAVAYLLRAAGDMSQVGGNALSWLSPIGWAQQTRMYVDDRWWPLLLSVAVTVALVGAAFWLSTRRDVAAGLRRPKPGRPRARGVLTTPAGFVWRMQCWPILWWAFGLTAFGLFYGSLAGELEDFVSGLSTIEEWIGAVGGAVIIESFLSMIVMMLAIAVAAFSVLSMRRLRTDETSGMSEQILATGVSRQRWALSHLSVTLGAGAVLMVLAGGGLGVTAALSAGEPSLFPKLLLAGLVHVPAVWLVAAIAMALIGAAPRFSALAWIIVAYAIIVSSFGELLGLPEWAGRLSPFGWVPLMPAEPFTAGPVFVLIAAAVALAGVGVGAWDRRDIGA